MIEYHYLNTCWKKIKKEKGSDALVSYFYRELFSRQPKSRELFPSDLETQKRTLLATIDNIINGAEHAEKIKDALLALGHHHKNLGVTADMYPVFIEIMIEAADFAANKTLTDVERHTWEKAYQEMVDLMLEAY